TAPPKTYLSGVQGRSFLTVLIPANVRHTGIVEARLSRFEKGQPNSAKGSVPQGAEPFALSAQIYSRWTSFCVPEHHSRALTSLASPVPASQGRSGLPIPTGQQGIVSLIRSVEIAYPDFVLELMKRRQHLP